MSGGLVHDLHGGRHGYDLGVQSAFRLRRGRPLLRAQGVFVLGVAGDAVALGHDLGRFQHGHVDVGRQLEQRLVLHPVQVHVLVLDQRDRIQPAADGDDLTVVNDLSGRGGDGRQARGTLAVQRHPRRRGGQAGCVGDLTRHIGAGGALLQRRAHDDVLDFGRIDARTCNRVADSVRTQTLCLGVVERAAIGPAYRRAGGGDDDGFTHGWLSLVRYCLARGASLLERYEAAP